MDGISVLDAGMNSGIVPQLLPPNQTALSINATHRGGFIRTRPAFNKVAIDYGDDALLQNRVETGVWQGAAQFKSEYGEEGIVASIGGRIFFFVIPLSGDITVRDVTPTLSGGGDDTNSNSNPIAWLWQAERWMIINDGNSLPIFFDGSVSRRSRGAAQLLGKIDIAFLAPAQGTAQNIILQAAYTGPMNDIVSIGPSGTYYLVNSSGVGYQIVAKNISDDPGITIQAGTSVRFPTNLVGIMSHQRTVENDPSPAIPDLGFGLHGGGP